MDPVTKFYLYLGCDIVLAAMVFRVMMRIQKRKEDQARRNFELFIKSKGMSLEVNQNDTVSNKHTVVKKISKIENEE